MNYIRVTKENASDFSSVLPEAFCTGREVSLAACEDDGAVCGAVSVTIGDDQYDVNWLYVAPEKRRQYVAFGLIREIRRMVHAIGIYPIRMEFEADGENGLYEFFLSVSNPDFPVDLDYSHDRYVVSAEDYIASGAMKEKRDVAYIPVHFWDMDEELRNSAMDLAMEHLSVTDPESFEATCEKKLCLAVTKNKKVLSFMLTQADAAGDLKLSYLYSENPAAMMAILSHALQWIKKEYRNARISFDTVTEEAEMLAEKIFPDAVKRAVYEAEF